MITGTALLRGSGSAVLAPHVALLAVEIDIVLNVVPPHLPLVTARPRGPPIPV